jgi:hypothetical protein
LRACQKYFFDKLKRRDGNRHAACLRYAYIS